MSKDPLKKTLALLESAKTTDDLALIFSSTLLSLIREKEEITELIEALNKRIKEVENRPEERIEEGDILRLIKPLIPSPTDGKDGKDGKKGDRGQRGERGERGKDGKNGVDGKDGDTILPLEIAAKLNSTTETVEPYVIKGFDEELKNIKDSINKIPTSRMSGMRKIPIIKRYELSSQLDGATKSFTLPMDTVDVLGVWGTQFPLNFSPSADWSFRGRTLTLSDGVGAPETGQTLWCLIETLFYG